MTTLPKDDAPRAPRPPGQAADGTSVRGAPSAAAPTPAPRATVPVPAPSGTGNLAPGTVIDGRYRVIRFLNQGGNGVVHEVEHLRTGRRLAMKSLVDDASAARLEQEARATSLMKNAHVVKITDMGPSPGARNVAPYLVMELLEGQSLRDLLDEAGQLPLELTVNIALQVCECLAEAHERSVIHRDLKPENLFLLRSPWPNQYDVVVLDFGVMKIAGEGPIPKGSLTRTGSTVGTPYYMSLEQLRNSSAVDARADIYSLGVVLYECLAGRKPFVADTIGDLVYALCSGPPTPLQRLRPDLPPDVCDAVMRALKMNRDDRQPSMTEIGAALLPHGHPAFGLWLRAGQSAPAATMTPMASLRDVARSPAIAAIAQVPTAIVPVAPAPPTPDEGEGTTVTAVAPHREIHVEDSVTSDGQPTGKLQARQRHDRETPTEMYQPAMTGGSAFGDRDTPTRALPAPSLPDLDAALARSGAGGMAPAPPATPLPSAGQPPTFRMEPPRFGAATQPLLGQEALAAQAPAQGAAPGPGAPPRFDAPQEITFSGPRGTGTFGAVAPAGAKPGWQVSLDKALASVGGFGESIAQKVKAQPPPIRYAILATGGLCAVLLLVLFVVLVFR